MFYSVIIHFQLKYTYIDIYIYAVDYPSLCILQIWQIRCGLLQKCDDENGSNRKFGFQLVKYSDIEIRILVDFSFVTWHLFFRLAHTLTYRTCFESQNQV